MSNSNITHFLNIVRRQMTIMNVKLDKALIRVGGNKDIDRRIIEMENRIKELEDKKINRDYPNVDIDIDDKIKLANTKISVMSKYINETFSSVMNLTGGITERIEKLSMGLINLNDDIDIMNNKYKIEMEKLDMINVKVKDIVNKMDEMNDVNKKEINTLEEIIKRLDTVVRDLMDNKKKVVEVKVISNLESKLDVICSGEVVTFVGFLKLKSGKIGGLDRKLCINFPKPLNKDLLFMCNYNVLDSNIDKTFPGNIGIIRIKEDGEMWFSDNGVREWSQNDLYINGTYICC